MLRWAARCLLPSLCALLLWTVGCTSQQIDDPDDGEPTTNASLEVRSVPSGARIFIDGQDTGKVTPAVIEELTGASTGTSYTVRLVLAGYHDYATSVTLYASSAGADKVLVADLLPVTTETGDVYVQTSPPGASVRVDGLATGDVTPVTLRDLGATTHVIEASLADHVTRTETVNVRAGRTEAMELILIRNDRTGMSGTVYDKIGGGMLVDAAVSLIGTAYETRTSAQGSYVFENLPTGYYDVLVEKTLQDGTELIGRRENVYVDPDNGRMMTADVLTATASEMGEVSGRITDASGRGIENAYVYLDMGAGVYFAPVDEDTGEYSFIDVPMTPEDEVYYVVASAPGYANSASELTVLAGQGHSVSLRLPEWGSATPVRPWEDWAQALTYPAGDDTILDATLALRRLHAERAGAADDPRLQVLERLAEDRAASIRAYPPAGFVIENDLFWLANEERDLAGYDVLRSEQSSYGGEVISTIWDPNAKFMADISPDLGAAQTFYYTLKAFNLSGRRSTASDALGVRPLDGLVLTSPQPGETPDDPLFFEWEPVSEAGVYEILVFADRPDYDTGHGPNPIWLNTAIGQGQTSIEFGDGGEPTSPTLTHGETYYGALVAGDGVSVSDSLALSYSSIVEFVAP